MITVYTFDNIKSIAKELKTNKKAAIIETDTVMGIIALNPDLIYKIKKRPKNKLLVTFISSINQMKGLTANEKRILKDYLPGPLTIVKNGVAYRIPNHKDAVSLIKLTGPIYSSSANISDCEPVSDIDEAIKVFGKNKDKIIFVEGKNLTNKPSTIVDLDECKILREGAIKGKELTKLLWKK